MTQDTLFPMTQLDIAQAFLNHFEEEVEKRTKSMLTAQAKLTEAIELRKMAEAELRRARIDSDAGTPEEIVAAMKAEAEAAGIGVKLTVGGETFVVSEPPEVDPITGEVASEAFVFCAWPDNPDMQRIEVGPLTRYGELAADFLASLPGDDPRREDSFADYRIIDVDDGSECDPHAVITKRDYGLEFSVEAPLSAAVVAP